MADPREVISRKTVWLDENGQETAPPNAGGLFGWGATNPTQYEIITYSNGEIWTSTNGQAPVYERTDPQLAANFRAQQPTEPNVTSQWTTKTDAEGNTWRVNEATGEKAMLFPAGSSSKPVQWEDPATGAQWIIDATTGEKIQQLSPAIPGWTPGRGVVAAPSTPQ
ncbi:MAG: hypothetical protein M0R06_22695, partial [Sphaerochaeta sp.]|nr:hypothetical protein [Sphaerochaeta sp.]